MNDKDANGNELIPATPAATLVVMRERSGGSPELLLVKRAAHMAFAAGAIVFPGGRIDPGDHDVAASTMVRGGGGDRDCRVARVAAIRETLEESGLALGFTQIPGADWIAVARERLATGEPFGAVLAGGDAALDLDALVPFARWRPNFREARVFDTRFYLARAHDGIGDPQVDATENVHSYWDSAHGVMRAADAGEVFVIYPTRRNLERIAQFDGFESARDHALMFPPQLISPFVEERGGVRYLCIPDDCGYPITAEPFDTAKRAGS